MQKTTTKSRLAITVLALGALTVGAAIAQQQLRNWDVNQITQNFGESSATLTYGANQTSINVSGETRTITTNSVPSHAVGAGNRNAPQAIQSTYRLDATPRLSGRTTYTATGTPFGVTVTGVLFDAFAAEWFAGDRSGWNYSVPGGAIPLGIDTNGGHVQPTGMYHYHDVPTALLGQLGWNGSSHSPLVGYAADGFPIYALVGQGGREMTSSYVLKSGSRPSGGSNPGGTYDGTFHHDWQYVAGAGTLDECNGTTTVTSEYPNGTYAYFLTESYPVIPACLKGTYSSDLRSGGGAATSAQSGQTTSTQAAGNGTQRPPRPQGGKPPRRNP